MEIDATILAVIGTFISSISLIITVFKVYVNQERRLTKLETKMELFWKAVGDRVMDMLHHPELARRDMLSEKVKARTITLAELEELEELLECELHEDKNKKSQKGLVVALGIAYVKTLLLDCYAIENKTKFKELLNTMR